MWTLKSIAVWARRRRIGESGVTIFSCFLLAILSIGDGARVPGVDRECNGIANHIRSKEFTYPWFTGPGGVFAITNSSLTCPIGRSGDKSTKCCRDLDSPIQKREMSTKFGDKWLGPKLQANGEIFKDRKKKFDVTFKNLLTRAHAAFHNMFERTYGMLYIQHAPIFHALFTTLEAYYDTGRESLEGKLNEFFAILTKKMFVVLNSQYEFDDKYLSCATIVISEKQGGELHRQIVSSLRRSFVATRALAQGLNDADKVFNSLQKLRMNTDCISSLSQMLQCPICSELRPYKPCAPLCISLTMSCLSSVVPLIKPWTEFTTAMENILDRLLGPYNVEAVVEPIHIKISEAIMNFQESGADLSQAVFSSCGKARLKSAKNLRKREAAISPPENLKKRPEGSSSKTSPDGFRANVGQSDTQPSKSLEKLLREIKSKVKKSKNMWDVLPRQVCNGIAKDYSSQLCWNGTTVMKPDRNKTGDMADLRSVTEEKGVTNPLVSEQILTLQQITERLRASFNGVDVKWVDENDELEFDGSGMGSGSGEIPTDLEDSDDDDPSGQIKPDKGRNRPSLSEHDFPSRPRPQPPHKTPGRPAPPPIFNVPLHEDQEEDEDEDEGEIRHTLNNWNPISNLNPTGSNNRGTTGSNNGFTIDPDNDDHDFEPHPLPPKVSKPLPPMFIPTERTTTTTTTTTTSTRRPPTDVIKRKHPSTTSGTPDEADRVIAMFKLFSPILASLVGKAFSFT